MAPDQQLDGSYREAPAPGQGEPDDAAPEFAPPPEPAVVQDTPPEPAAPPRRLLTERLKRRPRLLIAGAAVVAIAAGAVAVWTTSGSDTKPAPKARFIALPEACQAPSAAILSRYLPTAEKPTPDTGGISGQQQYAACDWREPLRTKKGKQLVSRHLHVMIRLFAGETALADAESEYRSSWRTSAQGTISDDVGSTRNEAPQLIRGLGDEAFLHHRMTTTALGRSRVSRMVTRTSNIVITVDFDGATYPLDHDGVAVLSKGTPLDKSTTADAAQAIVRDTTTVLTACRPCQHP
jgi:hypothetical protein